MSPFDADLQLWVPNPMPVSQRVVVALDIIGFTRFAEARISGAGAGAAEQIGDAVSNTFTAALEALHPFGFEVLDVQGDCLFASAPAGGFGPADATRFAQIAVDAIAQAQTGLLARGAGGIGPVGRFAQEDIAGHPQFCARGDLIEGLHQQMREAPVRSSQIQVPDAVPRAQISARQRAGRASIARVVVLCVRLCDASLAGALSDGQLRSALETIASLCAAYEAIAQKCTQDDKGLLMQVILPRAGFLAQEQALELANDIITQLGDAFPGMCIGLDAGPVYFGPVLLGDVIYETIHGPPANGAAKLTVGHAGGIVTAAGFATGSRGQSTRHTSAEQRIFGRQMELGWLQARLVQPDIPAIAVLGVSGVGKTFLTRQAALEHSAKTVAVALRPGDKSRPFSFLSKLLQGYRSRQPHAIEALPLIKFIQGYELQALQAAALLLTGGGSEVAIGSALRGITGTARRDLMIAVAKVLMVQLRPKGIAMLLIDDAQWMDEASLRVMRALMAEAKLPQLLLTVRTENQLPEALDPLVPAAQRLSLNRMSFEDFAALILSEAARLGVSDPPPGSQSSDNTGLTNAQLQDLYVACDGAPAIALQLVMSGGLTPDGPISSKELEDVLSNRVAQLDPGSAYLLQVLSALETGLTAAECEDLTAKHAAPLQPGALQALLDRRILAPSLGDTGQFEISHVMIADAIRARITPATHPYLHVQAARFLERLRRAGARDRAPLMAVAEQWRRAGRLGRAAVLFEREARAAEGLGAYQSVLKASDLALEALSGATQGAPRIARLWAMSANAHWGLGDIVNAGRDCHRALAMALPDWSENRPHLRIFQSLRFRLRRKNRLEQLEPVVSANAILGEVAYFKADTKSIIRANANALLLPARGNLRADSYVRGMAFFGVMLGVARAHIFARRCFASARRFAARNGTPVTSAQIDVSEATYHLIFARWEKSRALLERSVTVARQRSDLHLLRVGLTLQALDHYLRGDLPTSLNRFRALAAQATREETMLHLGWSFYGQAQVLLRMQEYAEAEICLAEAEEIVMGGADRQSEVICRGLRILLEWEDGDMQRAVTTAHEQVAHLDGFTPNNFSSLEGFAAAPEVFAKALIAGRGQAAERNALKKGLKQLKGFKRMNPTGTPRYYYCLALGAFSDGQARKAARLAQKGDRLARKLGMLGEQARLKELQALIK